MKSNRLCLALGVLCLAMGGVEGCRTIGSGEPRTVRLLTVGNSFSKNATHYLGMIAKADGNRLIHHDCIIWGGSMAQHWEKKSAFDRNPQDPAGLYFSKKSLKQELADEPWDFVTIQQASMRSHKISTYRPYARQLVEFIRTNAPQAEVLMHETWAYRCDDPRFNGVSTNADEPKTQKEMFEGLTRAYETVAAELGLRVIPVGRAFYAVDTDPDWGFRPDASFDAKTAQRPSLPNQTHSLHVGRTWSKDKAGKWGLRMDGHHANTAGEYLAACVFYEILFGKNAVGNTFVPKGLSQEEVAYLQKAAHKTVESTGVTRTPVATRSVGQN